MNGIRKPSRMTSLLLLALIAGWIAGWLSFKTPPAQASLYWFQGVRGKNSAVCFAGNAVDVRADRVREIAGHLQQFEYAANVRFLTIDGTPIQDAAAPGGNIQKLACPAPTWVGGQDYYDGDIRVALLNTNVPVDPPGTVPGTGCTVAMVGSSWSGSPNDLAINRPCQYNLKLGDDDTDMTVGKPGIPTGTPWLNHTLHEFGHALGLSHEHVRVDENAQCVPASANGYHTATTGFITPYDKNSIMHYRFWPDEVPQCSGQTGTNYSNDGLTAYDALALHIMYPEDVPAAEFTGVTVVKTGEAVVLRAAWTQRGATGFAVSNFQWRVDDLLWSTSDTLNSTFSPGNHTLQFSYQDFLDRNYSYTGTIRVLDAATFDAQTAAVAQAQLLMMMSSLPGYVYLPAVMR